MIIKTDSFKDKYKDKSKEEILDEFYEKYVESEKLKNKLRRYENPHTPPSKEVRKSRTNFISETGLAVGKKTGYKGATRQLKEPNDFINCFDNVCSQCGKHNKPHKVKSKIYEEIPDPQPVKIIKGRTIFKERIPWIESLVKAAGNGAIKSQNQINKHLG